MSPPFRIFLSSPGDVTAERDAAERAVARINGDHDTAPFELVRWEDAYYTARSTFQEQIDRPSRCDIVLCIFWKRLGSPLTDEFARPDGSVPTGTEFEFEDAIAAARGSPEKLPDLLVYRKTTPVTFAEETAEQEAQQRRNLLAFWDRWFRTELGQFAAGYQNFDATADFEALVERHLRDWLVPRLGEVTWTEGSPFRGLAPFDVAHAPIFFGRRLEVERARARFLANAVNDRRFLLVAGPSGSGKSSLVRAGLLARIARPGAASGVADAMVHATVKPATLGADSWQGALAQALFAHPALGPALVGGDFPTPDALAALLATPAAAAAALTGALRRDARAERHDPPLPEGGTVGLVLLVDQLEEIFAWEPAEAERFAACLAGLQAHPGLFVLATMRSDFLHRLPQIPALDALAGLRALKAPNEPDRVLHLGFPEPADLREMIAGPARVAGLSFEAASEGGAALDRRIETDTAPTALPAMQFLLAELYAARAGRVLTHAAYDALGGVTGVMAKRGEAVLSEMGAGADAAFARLMRALVGRTAPDLPAVTRSVAAGALAEGSAEARLAAALRDAHLLVSDEGRLRLAHDSLITGWARLVDLLERERRHYEARDRLAGLARADPQPLLEGFTLAEGRDLLAAWGAEALEADAPGLPALIARSERAATRKSRRRIALGTAVAAALTAAALGIGWFQLETNRAETTAEARLAVTRAESALRRGDWSDALAAARAAYALQPDFETRTALLRALANHSSGAIGTRMSGLYTDAIWTDDAALVTLSRNGEISRHDGTGTVPLGSLPRLGSGTWFAIAALEGGGFAGLDNRGRLARAGDASALELFDPDFPLLFGGNAKLAGTASGLVVVHPDPRSSGVTIHRCDTGSGALACAAPDRRDAGFDAPFDISGETLFLGNRDRVEMIDLDTGTATDLNLPTTGDLVALAASPAMAGTAPRLAFGQRSGAVSVLYDPARARSDIPGRGGPVVEVRTDTDRPQAALAWSAMGRLAYQCDSRTICVAEPAGPEPDAPFFRTHRLLWQDGPLQGLAFSPSGARLLARTASGEIVTWELDAPATAPAILPLPEEDVLPDLVAADGALVVRAGRMLARLGQTGVMEPLGVRPTRPDPDVATLAITGALASGADGTIAMTHSPLFGIADSVEIRAPDGRVTSRALNHAVFRLAVGPDGTVLAAGLDSLSVVPTRGDIAEYDVPGIGGITWDAARSRAILSLDTSALMTFDPATGAQAVLVDAARGSDAASALDLEVDATGRWLAATRTDDILRLYDLEGGATVDLALDGDDTKVATFSPGGGQIAALGSDGQIYVWAFDPASGRAVPTLRLDDVPGPVRRAGANRRLAQWIAFHGEDMLAIATAAGELVLLPVTDAALTARLALLDAL